jgi:hypothetical protein
MSMAPQRFNEGGQKGDQPFGTDLIAGIFLFFPRRANLAVPEWEQNASRFWYEEVFLP